MEYRRLGRSGLFVSALTLGTMTFGGQGLVGHAVPPAMHSAATQSLIALTVNIDLLAIIIL
jgi:aryl-alcohol dehydrogenase-like predicted oxidoreductase